MDYEQKYKEALGKLQEALAPTEDGCKISWLTRGCIENIFPELKESEDERIRKDIISYLRNEKIVKRYISDIEIDKWIAWLEKQGGQKPDDNVEPKFKVGDIVQYITDSTDRRKIEEIDTLCNMYHTNSSPIMFEIEDEWKVVVNAEDVEQESVDKVEPKFKVGDWISGYYTNYKVTAINSIGYVVEDTDGNKINILFKNEKFHHLWTIQDAKDGDLIYASTEVKGIQAIFHKFENGIIYFHCNLCGDFTQGGYEPSGDVEFVNPLPKTHYQRFFQKMKEACYEWDAKNKTLWQTK